MVGLHAWGSLTQSYSRVLPTWTWKFGSVALEQY